MKNGYITRYKNELNLVYDSAVFTNKREAMKKRGATKIIVVKCDYDSIYHGDNFRGWLTDDEKSEVIFEG